MGVLPTTQPKRKRGRPPKGKLSNRRKPGRKPKIALDLTQPISSIPGNEIRLDHANVNETDDDHESEDENPKKIHGLELLKKKKKKKSGDGLKNESGTMPKLSSAKRAHNDCNDREEDEDDSSEEEKEIEMEPPTDPETTLEYGKSYLTTVHFDPDSPAYKYIGWRIRISDDKHGDWKVGRIVRYD